MAACASLAPPIGHRVLGGAMFLLVIGLVAVIIAILVAAFLSMRRGSDDEDGPVERLSMRDRVRSRGRDRDARWEDADAPSPARRAGAREPVPSRRPGRAPREYTADDVADRVGFDSMPGYEPSARGYGGRAAGRGSDRARGDRAGRYDDATETIAQPAAAALRAAAPAGRRAAADFDTGPGTALYDTGPAAASFPSPAIDADPDLADSDVFPRVREDIPRPAVKPRQPSKPRQRSQPAKGRAGRSAAGMTMMTTTGPAPSGTSCPMSSTGPSCPRTSRCRTRPSRRPRCRPRPGRRPRAAPGAPRRPAPPRARLRSPAAGARGPRGRHGAPRGRRACGWPRRGPRLPGGPPRAARLPSRRRPPGRATPARSMTVRWMPAQ